jgi:hypothetical protein
MLTGACLCLHESASVLQHGQSSILSMVRQDEVEPKGCGSSGVSAGMFQLAPGAAGHHGFCQLLYQLSFDRAACKLHLP